MNISTKGRYALRLMLDLALNGGGEAPIPLKKIGERQEISVKYLEQIITVLCKAGFVKSIRGAQGGYKLTREPSEYTVGDILRLTEGSLAPVACLEDETNGCPRAQSCPTLFVWETLEKAINSAVDSITLQDIADRADENNSANCYVI